MIVFRGALVAAWLIVLAITVQAVRSLGVEGGAIFFDDFSHPWRAQFNTDFLIHLGLVGSWIAWREKWPLGLLLGALAIMGGLYTLIYVFVAAMRARGDMRLLLLGRHA